MTIELKENDAAIVIGEGGDCSLYVPKLNQDADGSAEVTAGTLLLASLAAALRRDDPEAQGAITAIIDWFVSTSRKENSDDNTTV